MSYLVGWEGGVAGVPATIVERIPRRAKRNAPANPKQSLGGKGVLAFSAARYRSELAIRVHCGARNPGATVRCLAPYAGVRRYRWVECTAFQRDEPVPADAGGEATLASNQLRNCCASADTVGQITSNCR